MPEPAVGDRVIFHFPNLNEDRSVSVVRRLATVVAAGMHPGQLDLDVDFEATDMVPGTGGRPVRRVTGIYPQRGPVQGWTWAWPC